MATQPKQMIRAAAAPTVPIPRVHRPSPIAQDRHPRNGSGNGRTIRARFDSQFTTDDNRNRWALADSMSIDASASWMIRRTLRMRSRYEYHNNSYFQGIAETISDYVVGTGPILQVTTASKSLNKLLEKSWNAWAQEIGLAETLYNSRTARIYNGEGFSLMRTNPELDHPIKLDIFEIECDQVSSPLFGMYPSQYPDQFFDGVVLNPWGRPQTYHILRQHPGSFGAFVMMGYEFDAWPARYVIHDYKRIRPGQQRGIPEALPALPLFMELRAYAGAVRAAAETAADYAMTIETQAPADTEAESEFGAMDVVELQRRMATVLPAGARMNQTKAEQPTTQYDAFETATVRQIARCLKLPLFVALGDARLANMSSAYISMQPFVKSVQKDRVKYNNYLDRIFKEWLSEARRVPGLFPNDLPEEMPHIWRWPRIGQHADPMKTANARETSLRGGWTSIPHECAEDGRDWEEVQESAAKSLGMSVDEYRAALREAMFTARGTEAPDASIPEKHQVTDPEDDPLDEEPAGEQED